MDPIRRLYRKTKYLLTAFRFRIKGYQVGKYFMTGKSVRIQRAGFRAGDCCYIGGYSYLGPHVKLGHFCMVSDHVNIIGDDHVFDRPGVPVILGGVPKKSPETVLEDDVWIGHGSTIMRGCRLGEGCIVAANSVVTKDVKPFSIVAGVPARPIKMRFSNEDAERHSEFLQQYRDGELILQHDRRPDFIPVVAGDSV